MKDIKFIPFKFRMDHDEKGSKLECCLDMQTREYKNLLYKKIDSLFDENDFYNFENNEELFRFINKFIDFNLKNSEYPKQSDINPFRATIGKINKEKHSIFDSLLPFGYALSKHHYKNLNNDKIFKKITTSNYDNVEYDLIINEILKSYKSKLKLFEAEPLTNLYFENTMLVTIFEKIVKNGLFVSTVISLSDMILNSNVVSKDEKESVKNLNAGNTIGSFTENSKLLFSICVKYKLLPELEKHIELIMNEQYINDDGQVIKNTLNTLLDNKILSIILGKNFTKFLRKVFEKLGLRNDYLHMNCVWYNIYNIMMTAILIHILYLTLIRFKTNRVIQFK